MKKLLLTLIVPLVLGTVFIGCEPIEEGELPEDPAAIEQEM
ncbi:MAG: hypothetical protein PF508_20145 [Spirochaeta sp.]|jgi:hypothetical protein|nr:hypothetical protein [Spirochaeta sp.]